jgi:hypothetical protein
MILMFSLTVAVINRYFDCRLSPSMLNITLFQFIPVCSILKFKRNNTKVNQVLPTDARAYDLAMANF